MGVKDIEEEIDETEVEETEVAETPEPSRDEMYAEAESEGVQESVISELAEKENITLEDLRKIPGTENLSDAELKAHWGAAIKSEGTVAEEKTPVELPFPVYDEKGNKVSRDKVTLEDLFSGKVTVGYQAMGKEQRKALTEVLRNASQGHWNEHRYTTVQGQLSEKVKEANEFRDKVNQFTQEREQWNTALTALIAGDKGPMERIVSAYQKAMTTSGVVPAGFVSQESVAAERAEEEAGRRWMDEVASPKAWELAQKYEANPQEVLGAIKHFIQAEPALTQARLKEILDFDVPMAFEAQGYKAKAEAGAGAGDSTELAQLKSTVAALQKRIADDANGKTAAVRGKIKNAPPAGSGSVAGAGDSTPTFKSRAQFKAWSQNDPDWAKA